MAKARHFRSAFGHLFDGIIEISEGTTESLHTIKKKVTQKRRTKKTKKHIIDPQIKDAFRSFLVRKLEGAANKVKN